MTLRELYEDEKLSIPQISARISRCRSWVRRSLIKAGIKLRSRAEGIKMSGQRLSSMRTGKKRPPFTQQHRAALRHAAYNRRRA